MSIAAECTSTPPALFSSQQRTIAIDNDKHSVARFKSMIESEKPHVEYGKESYGILKCRAA